MYLKEENQGVRGALPSCIARLKTPTKIHGRMFSATSACTVRIPQAKWLSFHTPVTPLLWIDTPNWIADHAKDSAKAFREYYALCPDKAASRREMAAVCCTPRLLKAIAIDSCIV